MKGTIFDFNGTMYFDEDKQDAAWEQFLYRLIDRKVTKDEMLHFVHGRNNQWTLEYFLQRKLNDAEVNQLVAEKESLYLHLCLADRMRFHLVNGLPEFLDEIKQRHGAMTIATASGRDNVLFFLEHLHLNQWFDIDHVVYDDGKIPSKPDPAIFQRASKLIGKNPADCIIFEDSPSGLQAAHSAKIGTVIQVAEPGETPQQIDGHADQLITDYWNAVSFL